MAEKYLEHCETTLRSSEWCHVDRNYITDGTLGAMTTIKVTEHSPSSQGIIETSSDNVEFSGDPRDLWTEEQEVHIGSFKLALCEASVGPIIEFLNDLLSELKHSREK